MVLHDSHAEVLALRALNFWLINECASLVEEEKQAMTQETGELHKKLVIIRRRVGVESHDKIPPFEIHPDVKIYMYSTCAPCGDCSMELCMAEQDNATPWVVPSEPDITTDQPTLLDGRAHFSIVGVVRRKPSRRDAEPTCSKSCSDKLALRQVTSILSYSASFLIAPTSSAYITALVLPEEEISQAGCERAFGGGPTGRLRSLVGKSFSANHMPNTEATCSFRPFDILAVPMEIVVPIWPFGKYRSDRALKARKPSNISALWIATNSSLRNDQPIDFSHVYHKPRVSSESTAIIESIIGGVKQGSKAKSMSLRGASIISRIKIWALVHNICTKISDEDDRWQNMLGATSYGDLKAKHCDIPWLIARSLAAKEAKLVLKTWIPNKGDESWGKPDPMLSHDLHR